MSSFSTFPFASKRAIVRVDFNVPLDKQSNKVLDDKRILAALPTLKHILNTGGSVVLLSHFGRPKNGPEQQYSLLQIKDKISEVLNAPVQFAADCIGQEAMRLSAALKPGQVLLLENVRFYKEETQGDQGFAAKLAKHGDCYVNDAFGAAHRSHASTTQIANFFPDAKMAGLLMQAEIENAQKVLHTAKKPFTAIVGGAKISDKVLIVENLLKIADHIIIGGGMAYTFFKAMGGQIGNSLCENDRLETCKDILQRAAAKGVQIHLPQDAIVADRFSNDANTRIEHSNRIENNWMGLDIGPIASASFKQVILQSKTILWNGPMGVFEMPAFELGTKSIAQAVAQATKFGAFSLIGGGDSAAAIQQFNLSKQVSYISTGGGALLEYFEGKTLPGIAALSN